MTEVEGFIKTIQRSALTFLCISHHMTFPDSFVLTFYHH